MRRAGDVRGGRAAAAAVRWSVTGGPGALRPAARGIAAAVVARGVPPARAAAVELVAHELLANALEHGHLGDADLPIDVEVVRGGTGRVIVRVVDRAVGGPWSPPERLGARPAGLDAERGRGLALVAAAASAWRVVPTARSTCVEVELSSLAGRGRVAG
ncbi:MAG: ATP-binding protein [Nitriliruptoraceae bacterium]